MLTKQVLQFACCHTFQECTCKCQAKSIHTNVRFWNVVKVFSDFRKLWKNFVQGLGVPIKNPKLVIGFRISKKSMEPAMSSSIHKFPTRNDAPGHQALTFDFQQTSNRLLLVCSIWLSIEKILHHQMTLGSEVTSVGSDHIVLISSSVIGLSKVKNSSSSEQVGGASEKSRCNRLIGFGVMNDDFDVSIKLSVFINFNWIKYVLESRPILSIQHL